jgi:hypothetical protein
MDVDALFKVRIFLCCLRWVNKVSSFQVVRRGAESPSTPTLLDRIRS